MGKYVEPGTGPRADLHGQGEVSVSVEEFGNGQTALTVNDGYRPARIELPTEVARQVAGWLTEGKGE